MNKARMAMLERAFEAEISGALHGTCRIMQTRSKVAEQLALEGYLNHRAQVFGMGRMRVTVRGYELTHLGRLTYCAECDPCP